MSADLELLLRVFVDERATDHAVLFDLRRQRNRAGHEGPRPLSRLDDLLRGLVQNFMIVRLQADANLLLRHAPNSPFRRLPASGRRYPRWGSPSPSSRLAVSLNNLGADARTYRAAALSDREPQPFLDGHRHDQLHRHLRVVPRHHHLHALLQRDVPRYVRRPDVE